MMTHRRSLAFPMSLVLAGLVAGTVVAGGWAEVAVTDPPLDPPVGSGTTVGLQVMQHGVTPVSWPTLTVVATDKVTGESFRTEARAEGPEGHYVATLTFPAAGSWALTFDSIDLAMSGFSTVRVGPAAVGASAAPVVGGAEPAPQPGVGDIEPVVWLGIAGLFALGLGLMVAGRRGRRTTTVPG
jgi:hypothetical protein